MKPKTIVFVGILLVLCVYTTSLLAEHTLEEAHQKGTSKKTSSSSGSKSTSSRTSSKSATPSKSPAKTTTPTKKTPPKINPPTSNKKTSTSPQNQQKTTDAQPAPAQTPVRLCNFNKLVLVPGSNQHRFTVKTLQTTKYSASDFDVTWVNRSPKKHAFFNWIGSQMKFDQAIKTMNCKRANVNAFGKVCGISTDLQKTYDVAFGKHPIYRCTIPQNNFIISVRFVLQLSNFATSPAGRWSVFTGLYAFKSEADAKKIIGNRVREIAKQIRATRLNTFDINLNLNIIPEFVKGSLTWAFNSNINSPFVQKIQNNKPYNLEDFGYAKILRPGTEFIIGNIFDGTTAVKQICEVAPFDNNNNCRVSI